jgi:hypothetical protein
MYVYIFMDIAHIFSGTSKDSITAHGMDKYVHGIQLMANSYDIKSKKSDSIKIKKTSIFEIFEILKNKFFRKLPFNNDKNTDRNRRDTHTTEEDIYTENKNKTKSSNSKKNNTYDFVFGIRSGSISDETYIHEENDLNNSSIDYLSNTTFIIKQKSTQSSYKGKLNGLYFLTNLQLDSAFDLNLISKEKYQYYKEGKKESHFYPFL